MSFVSTIKKYLLLHVAIFIGWAVRTNSSPLCIVYTNFIGRFG